MTVRFAAQDGEWTESMKKEARSSVLDPLEKIWSDCEISLHISRTLGEIEIWAVLQGPNGVSGIVRQRGEDFDQVIADVGLHLKKNVIMRPRKSFNYNPLQMFLPEESFV